MEKKPAQGNLLLQSICWGYSHDVPRRATRLSSPLGNPREFLVSSLGTC